MPKPISPRELAATMQGPVALQLIDVRRPEAFETSARILIGAFWHDPADIESWITGIDASRPVVVYCVRGHQVSQDCARRLEKAGHSVAYLEGGIELWVAESHPTASKPSRSE